MRHAAILIVGWFIVLASLLSPACASRAVGETRTANDPVDFAQSILDAVQSEDERSVRVVHLAPRAPEPAPRSLTVTWRRSCRVDGRWVVELCRVEWRHGRAVGAQLVWPGRWDPVARRPEEPTAREFDVGPGDWLRSWNATQVLLAASEEVRRDPDQQGGGGASTHPTGDFICIRNGDVAVPLYSDGFRWEAQVSGVRGIVRGWSCVLARAVIETWRRALRDEDARPTSPATWAPLAEAEIRRAAASPEAIGASTGDAEFVRWYLHLVGGYGSDAVADDVDRVAAEGLGGIEAKEAATMLRLRHHWDRDLASRVILKRETDGWFHPTFLGTWTHWKFSSVDPDGYSTLVTADARREPQEASRTRECVLWLSAFLGAAASKELRCFLDHADESVRAAAAKAVLEFAPDDARARANFDASKR